MQERQLLGVLDCYQEVQAAGNSDGHAGGLDMQGTACIAWLPDGRFTGAHYPWLLRPPICCHCWATSCRCCALLAVQFSHPVPLLGTP